MRSSHGWRLVGRQVIQHHVDPAATQASMSRRNATNDAVACTARSPRRSPRSSAAKRSTVPCRRSCGSGVQGAQDRQDRLRPLERLDLGSLRTRPVGRVHVQARTLATSCGADSLNDSVMWGCRPNVRQIDHGVDAGRLGHGAGAPVRLAFRRRLQGFDNDRLDSGVGRCRGALTRGSSYNPSIGRR